VVCADPALTQQVVPFDNGRPVLPRGLPIPPLPDAPLEFATAEGQDIRVVVYARDLEYPYSLAFLPDGGVLVTERPGRLRIIRDGVLDPEPIVGAPVAFFVGESGVPGAVHGYMDIALHPEFDENQLIYLPYSKPVGGGGSTLALARGRWAGGALTEVDDIFIPDGGNRARIAFDHEGMLFFTTNGEAASQDLNSHAGKILRLHDDGSVPKDNPFVGLDDHKPEVYAFGTRTTLGLAVHPETGQLWQAENGPNGGDEINIILPGRNYGWPIVSYGRTYPGPWQSEYPNHENFEPPVVFWMPSIAVSGLTFYTGDALPNWKGDVFVGGLRTGEIPGTGHVERILFNENMEELRRESLLVELRQRIRDIRQGPDGFLYLTTDAKEGAVLRIEPAH
jgi:glucose/arabinose dehydrogenase